MNPQNEYRIVKSMGRGSFGAVFLVEHVKNKQLFVIKKIQMKDINEKEKATIENEVRLLQDLKHINIVSYRDSFIDREGFLNIVMQNCQEGDLYHRIRANPAHKFEEKQVVEWAVQMCLAIHYMHQKRILHRDLKTQNIFLTGGRIRLGDFGISKVLDESQQLTSTMIGTPYYMCPELFRGKSYSYKSDIWALGCVFYEICNQRHAFEAQNFNALGVRVMKGTYSPVSSQYSKPLKDLIGKMLTVNARERPTIVDVLRSPVLKKRVISYMQECLRLPASEENHIQSLIQQAESLGINLQEGQSINNPIPEIRLTGNNNSNSNNQNTSRKNVSVYNANNISSASITKDNSGSSLPLCNPTDITTPRLRGQKSSSDLRDIKDINSEKSKFLREELRKQKLERERIQEELRKSEEKRRNQILQRERQKRLRSASQEKLRRISASERRLIKDESSLIRINEIDTAKNTKATTQQSNSIFSAQPSPKASSGGLSAKSFNKSGRQVPEMVVLPKIDAHKKEFKMEEEYDMNFEQESEEEEEPKMENIHQVAEDDDDNQPQVQEKKGVVVAKEPQAPQSQPLSQGEVQLMKSQLKQKTLKITLLQTQLQKIDFEVSDDSEQQIKKDPPQPPNPKYVNVQERINAFKARIEHVLGTGGLQELYTLARNLEQVENSQARIKMLSILEPKQMGLWHLMDQVISLERVLRDIPEYL